MMLQRGDEEWLRDRHPGLTVAAGNVSGPVAFRAGYDPTINQFYSIEQGTRDPAGAVVLSGAFQIHIQPRTNQSTSHLPALSVEGIRPIADRHFNAADNSACLCSPLEEDAFLQPLFQFRPYMDELVIPFLYGQVYFSAHNRWPWSEYAHGATGLLEAYAKAKDRRRAAESLRLISQDSNWSKFRAALLQKPHVKGHTPCFCSSGQRLRCCHPAALEGALLLQKDIKELGITIPDQRSPR